MPFRSPKNHVDGSGLFVKFRARLTDLESSKLLASNKLGTLDWWLTLCVFNFRRSELARAGYYVSWPNTTNAHVAQLVEHVLGKDEVTGSIPVMGSMSSKSQTIEVKTLARVDRRP